VTSLPETLVRFRTDLEDAIRREQGSRRRHGRLRRRPVVLVATALVVIAGAASAFAIVRAVEDEPYPVGKASRTVDGVRFSFTAPQSAGCRRAPPVGCKGWADGPTYQAIPDDTSSFFSTHQFISKSVVGPQGAEAVIFWTGFRDRSQMVPCAKLLGGVAGGSTADVAAAMARAPGTKLVERPMRVTVGGRPAMHVVVTVRRDRGCDPGYFFRWRRGECWGECWLDTAVGDTIRVWVVDVRGTLVVFEAETKPRNQRYAPYTKAQARQLEQEIAAIIESIRFD
jgi:hypothetical protein